MTIVHACTKIIVRACTMIIVHAYTMIIVHACIVIMVTVSCPAWLIFDAIKDAGSRGQSPGFGGPPGLSISDVLNHFHPAPSSPVPPSSTTCPSHKKVAYGIQCLFCLPASGTSARFHVQFSVDEAIQHASRVGGEFHSKSLQGPMSVTLMRE